MSPSAIFLGLVALCVLALLASIARDCSAIADMMHDEQERRRHG
ncbi:hypothetical protein [Rhizorhabdus histidinilytica]|nr:hypothetical protein [Rhizorhabdus histidinilytica]